MRALETGRYVVQATNDGVTSLINPQGQTMASLPRNEQVVLKGSVYGIEGQTPWLKYGLLPVIFIALLFALLALVMYAYRRIST